MCGIAGLFDLTGERPFERALVEGRMAGLLDQERSSLFTQQIGNVPPGAEMVGYPEPDRSHFRSTDIWHSAEISVDLADFERN